MRLFFALVFIRFFFFFFLILSSEPFSEAIAFDFKRFDVKCQRDRGSLSVFAIWNEAKSVAGEKHFAGHIQMDKWVPNFVFLFLFFPPPHYQEKTFCLGSRRKQHHNGRFHSSKESTKWNTERSLCQLNTYQCILTALQISSRSMNGVLFKWALLFS